MSFGRMENKQQMNLLIALEVQVLQGYPLALDVPRMKKRTGFVYFLKNEIVGLFIRQAIFKPQKSSEKTRVHLCL